MNRLTIGAALLALFSACTHYEQGVMEERQDRGLVSAPLGDENFGEYHVTAVYFPIHGNIDNQASPVFVSATPTTEQSLNFSMNAPVYSWTIYRGFSEIKTITLDERFDGWKSHWTWYVFDEWHKTSQKFPAYFAGQMTEHRFRELTNPDSLSSADLLIADTTISASFGEAEYGVIPYYRIRHKLNDFIGDQRLYDPSVDVGTVQPDFNGSPGTYPGTPTPPPAPPNAVVPTDPFIVRSGTLDSSAHACLANLYGNQLLMSRNHVHCSIDETISITEGGGSSAASVTRKLTHDLPVLPNPKSDFTFALFPGFQLHDTFSLIDENSKSITFGMASSNPVFRQYLGNTVLRFDRSTGALAELSATIYPPAEEIDKSNKNDRAAAIPAPFTIHYKRRGETVLPFESGFTREVKREGKAAVAKHEMVYRY